MSKKYHFLLTGEPHNIVNSKRSCIRSGNILHQLKIHCRSTKVVLTVFWNEIYIIPKGDRACCYKLR